MQVIKQGIFTSKMAHILFEMLVLRMARFDVSISKLEKPVFMIAK